MATIIPFLGRRRAEAFEPEVIAAMSHAYDEACAHLNIPADEQAARELIAGWIIDFARRGERNPDRLRDATLKAVAW